MSPCYEFECPKGHKYADLLPVDFTEAPRCHCGLPGKKLISPSVIKVQKSFDDLTPGEKVLEIENAKVLAANPDTWSVPKRHTSTLVPRRNGKT